MKWVTSGLSTGHMWPVDHMWPADHMWPVESQGHVLRTPAVGI